MREGPQRKHPVKSTTCISRPPVTNRTLDYIESKNLFARVNSVSKNLRDALVPLASHPNVGEIRGLGLLLGIEFVKNKSTREPFSKEENISEKIRQAALQKNVLTYPSQGCVDGLRGDHILLAPPFILTSGETQLIATALEFALQQVFPSR